MGETTPLTIACYKIVHKWKYPNNFPVVKNCFLLNAWKLLHLIRYYDLEDYSYIYSDSGSNGEVLMSDKFFEVTSSKTSESALFKLDIRQKYFFCIDQ